MNFLGLDLGSLTGYCFNHDDQFECGTWKLATDTEVRQWGKDRSRRRCDPRVTRLHTCLVILQDKHNFGAVVFEDILFASTTYQAHLWASLRAAVWLSFPADKIDCVPVGTLKSFATGSGAATKPMMAQALARRDSRFNLGKKNSICYWPGAVGDPVSLDDNAVDAVWLHKWAEANLSRS